MDKRLKIGLLLMLGAVVTMPIAFLFRVGYPDITLAALIFTMTLEFAGLIFVLLSIWKSRKSKN